MAIPPLLIQNFTENAVKYSVSMNYEVRIDVKAERMDAQTIRIRIADTGKGLPENVLEAVRVFQRTRENQECLGVGIRNAIERLEIMYHGKAWINFYNRQEGGAVIDITLPDMTLERTGDEEG